LSSVAAPHELPDTRGLITDRLLRFVAQGCPRPLVALLGRHQCESGARLDYVNARSRTGWRPTEGFHGGPELLRKSERVEEEGAALVVVLLEAVAAVVVAVTTGRRKAFTEALNS
jgi:hypothetical protein